MGQITSLMSFHPFSPLKLDLNVPVHGGIFFLTVCLNCTTEMNKSFCSVFATFIRSVHAMRKRIQGHCFAFLNCERCQDFGVSDTSNLFKNYFSEAHQLINQSINQSINQCCVGK
jgi:hypothetical protein